MDQHILRVEDVSVRRSGLLALEEASLAVVEGETLALIGPNGAGKSTLLLVLAKLIEPDRGKIFFRDQLITKEKALAYRRKVGIVMQEPLLLDTSVEDNVATGLRFRGVSKVEIDKRVNHWLDRLGIAGLRKRRARELSGGEAQRTSLARALALNPDVLFLDEPFSALDAPTRERLLADFYNLLGETSMTTVFVTHDRDEALLLGDRVAVLLDARIRQIGKPNQVFAAPSDPEIARFVGVETVIEGLVEEVNEGLAQIRVNGFHLEAIGNVRVGQSVLVCLRPEDVTLWKERKHGESSARNTIPGTIVRLTPQGPLERVVVDCGFPVVALITRASRLEMNLEMGMPVVVSFKASAVHVIAR